MAKERDWLDYVDLILKALVPAAIAMASWVYNDQQAEAHAKESCIDLQIKMFSLGCAGGSCAPDQRGLQLIGLKKLADSRCADAGIPLQDRSLLLETSQQVHSVDLATQLKALGGASLPAPVRLAAPAAAKVGAVAADTSATPRPRLYVHIADERQREAAKALIARVTGATFRDQSLLALGPQLIAQSPSRTELRCVKKADCASAPALASYLSGLLNESIRVQDLSAVYENSPNARPGHYELWFGSQDSPPVLDVTPHPPAATAG